MQERVERLARAIDWEDVAAWTICYLFGYLMLVALRMVKCDGLADVVFVMFVAERVYRTDKG